MRLTTLARKINKTPKKLIIFLEEKGIELTNGLHGKLDPETVEMVLTFFPPEEKNEEIQPQDNEIVEEVVETVEIPEEILEIEEPQTEKIEELPALDAQEIPDEEVALEEEVVIEKSLEEEKEIEPEVEEAEISEVKIGTIDDLESEDPVEIDLIKVRKVKLEGIKVVGKIDLPEKPEKEASDETNETEEAIAEKPEADARQKNESFGRKRTKNKRGNKQPELSYEERQKLEERQKFRKRRKKEYEEKKRKKKFYEENLQPKLNLTPKKKHKKQNPLSEQRSKKKVVAHKNPIKRLWAWLNGKYDSH